MKQRLLLHPLGQSCALVCGLCTHIVCMGSRHINRVRHINLGLYYSLMASFGFTIGIIMYIQIGKNDMRPWIDIHQMIGAVMILLFVKGTGRVFLLLKRAENEQEYLI